nr:DUF5983 family protein [Pantoea multigeneris]
MLVCSTACLSREDGELLEVLARQQAFRESSRWVTCVGYGWLVRPEILENPALTLREAGLSENTVSLLTAGIARMGVQMVIFDQDADPLENWPVFDW